MKRQPCSNKNGTEKCRESPQEGGGYLWGEKEGLLGGGGDYLWGGGVLLGKRGGGVFTVVFTECLGTLSSYSTNLNVHLNVTRFSPSTTPLSHPYATCPVPVPSGEYHQSIECVSSI